jgi:hypothetical protein
MDTLRLVSFDDRQQRPVTVLDLNDGVTFDQVRNSFSVVAPAKTQQFAASGRRYGGKRLTQETQDNGVVGSEWYISGASRAAATTALELLLSEVERSSGRPRFIEWRPDGSATSIFYQLRGGAPWEPMYQWVESVGKATLHLKAAFFTAPLGRGYSLDQFDDFNVDSRADYTQRNGAFAGVPGNFAVSGGALAATASCNTSNAYYLTNDLTGYTVGDNEQTVYGLVGATISGFQLGVMLKWIDVNNYIRVYAVDTGAATNLLIDVMSGGVLNTRTTTALTRIVASTPFYVRARIEGNVIYSEYYLLPAVPDLSAPSNQGVYTLTVAEAANVGESVRGSQGPTILVKNTAADAIYSWEKRPHTYGRLTAGASLPDEFRIASVPGTAEALCDLQVKHIGAQAAAPLFAMLGWIADPPPFNYVHNGDFEDDADGWNAAAVASLHVAATSAVRATNASQYGANNLTVTTNGVATSGVDYLINRRFKAGRVYTADVWTRCGSAQVQKLLLGTVTDSANTTWTDSTSTYIHKTVTWRPVADTDFAYVSIQTPDAVSFAIRVDAVMVYEGTVAPTLPTQIEGRGGALPFGIIEGEQHDSGSLSGGWAFNALAGSRASGSLYVTGTNNAGDYVSQYYIDPALLLPDDFSEDGIALEFWARMRLHANATNPRVILSALPEGGTTYGAQQFTPEYGSTGKRLTVPSSSTAWRFDRLGTLTLRSDRDNPARVMLKFNYVCSAALSGSPDFALDYLAVVPSQARALSPTAKSAASGYPKFISTTTETTKRINNDLSGRVRRVGPGGAVAHFSDVGLGGSVIELAPGTNRAFLKLCSLVPDDPTVDASTELLAHNGIVHFAITPRYFLLRSD